jgi:hypothetical protein
MPDIRHLSQGRPRKFPPTSLVIIGENRIAGENIRYSAKELILGIVKLDLILRCRSNSRAPNCPEAVIMKPVYTAKARQ